MTDLPSLKVMGHRRLNAGIYRPRAKFDVRFGSKADILLDDFDVRFTSESGHR